MKDRAGGDRGLLRALDAHPQALAGAPPTPAAAFRAGESIRPSKLREVFAAGGVVGEPGLELLKGGGSQPHRRDAPALALAWLRLYCAQADMQDVCSMRARERG